MGQVAPLNLHGPAQCARGVVTDISELQSPVAIKASGNGGQRQAEPGAIVSTQIRIAP